MSRGECRAAIVPLGPLRVLCSVWSGLPALGPSTSATETGNNSADKVAPSFWVRTSHSSAALEQEAKVQGLHKEQDSLRVHIRCHRPIRLSRLNQGLHGMTMVPPPLL